MAKGRIITFYSYKGGVGRTLALANIGVLLAKRGNRVLLMDWDLEAPGLDRYFRPFLNQIIPKQQGIIHVLYEADTGADADWRTHVQQITLNCDSTSTTLNCTLSLISSGVASKDYTDKMRAFSWSRFMQERGGGPILERWREEWKAEFDFVLIDSRTGITDAGGICTILLPDFLVLVFSANDQSFEGALDIAQSAQIERRRLSVQRHPLMILPLVSRFDRTDEVAEADKWLGRFARELKPIYDIWLPQRFHPIQILQLTKIPYITAFSFGEPLPVLSHGITDPQLPGWFLEHATRLLASDFREAGRIIDPNEAEPQDFASRAHSLIQRVPFDEPGLHRLVREAEVELGEGESLAALLVHIGMVLCEQARLVVAEPFYRRALGIDEKRFGPAHPNIARDLDNLVQVLKDTNRLAEAEPLMRRALDIDEKSFGPEHPNIARDLNSLAQILKDTNRLAEAEPLMRRALDIDEKSFGSEHPNIARDLNHLAQILSDTNRLAEAEPLMLRALAIDEKSLGSDHPDVAVRLDRFASLLVAKGRLIEAEPLMWRALAIDEKSLGSDHPNVAIRLGNLARILKDTNRLALPFTRKLRLDGAFHVV